MIGMPAHNLGTLPLAPLPEPAAAILAGGDPQHGSNSFPRDRAQCCMVPFFPSTSENRLPVELWSVGNSERYSGQGENVEVRP